MRASRHLLAVAAAATFLSRAATSVAEDASGSTPGAPVEARAPEVHPPELVEPVEPQYPPQARAGRIEGSVGFRLSIDATGVVTEAEVIEPAGHGFDEAARETVLRARFRPARRGDTAIASRILFRVDFRLPEEPAPEASETPTPEAGGAGVAAPQLPPLPSPEAGARQETPVEVTVRGPSLAQSREQSAEAVDVIELEHARRETADMGEVLARTEGVSVRRQGGLGSDTRFSLNGLSDDRVRFFLDGVPLELAGYPFGVANVPVNLIERVEIHSGVVPVRFGADALGGAVDLVTSQAVQGTRAAASYEVGSFGTYRLTLGARHLDAPSGFFTRVNAFFDYAKNDYEIDVEVPDERGRLSAARVHRFHDRYRAAGANAEVGLVDRSWAKRLLLRAFLTDYDKEYQHNVVMSVPYGGVTYGESAWGTSLRYEQSLGHAVDLDAVAGYSHTRGHFLDVASCVYDWYGRCVRTRTVPGETDSRPHDQLSWDHSTWGRLNLAWSVDERQTLLLSIAPTAVSRTGDERRQTDPTARDPLTAQRDLLTFVNGGQFEVALFEDRLENVAFVKQYVQFLDSEERRPGNVFRRRDRNTHRFGFGDALRYRFFDWLFAKTSYEFATRLPRPDEVFGDNIFIVANLELEPETSHNLNLGLIFDERETSLGDFRAEANGFLRDADQLIVLLGSDLLQKYQNVYGATSLGVDGAVGWTSPGAYLVLDGNITYQEFRNSSGEGTFGNFEGDRIPNRPYLFANASWRVQFRDVALARDEVAVFWNGRYVHEYFRGWESIGLLDSKQVIPAQLVHTLGLGYVVRAGRTTVSSTFEVQNLTDEALYDYFGVQRPGRAFYLKSTAEF